MHETLQEFVDSRGVAVRVDREQGIIRGVKLLGLVSRNGRSYSPQALREAAPLYEGVKVNVNRPKGHPQGPRDYQDRIGVVRHIELRDGEGLFGDFCFNPKHALAEQLLWDAQHAPENVGFSHNVQARVARQGDNVTVEAITKVASVDLVADPATTRGLFEHAESAALAGLTLDQLRTARPDLMAAAVAEQAEQTTSLRRELETLRCAEHARQREQAARRLLREFELPEPESSDPAERAIVSEAFWAALRDARDETEMRRLVEDRARLASQTRGAAGNQRRLRSKPLSRDQHTLESQSPVTDARSFARAIT